MVSQKLRFIFLTTIVLFIIHGMEELSTGFYNSNTHVKFMFGFAEKTTPVHAAFLTFQIMIWLMLIISYLLTLGPKWQLRLMVLPGVIFIYELHHFYEALHAGGYSPGLMTALFFPIVGYFFWKEYLAILYARRTS